MIYAGSYLLRATDPIQEKSISNVTEPLKNMQSLLIWRDIPLIFSSRTPLCSKLALLTTFEM